jgi:hypothetical protein
MSTHKARQVQITWDRPEAFKLIVESMTDGERIQRQQQQFEADRRAAEQRQESLLDWEDAAKQYQPV